MIIRLLLILFAALNVALLLYRLLIPPPLPFEIHPAPRTIFTFGVIYNDNGEIIESRNTYIVKGYRTISQNELKRKIDSFTCTILPDTLIGKGTYKISFYRYSERTQDKHLAGPLAEDIVYWAREDYLMSYSYSQKELIWWLGTSEDLLPEVSSQSGIVEKICQ